jgi:hypothetical protein
MTRKDMTQMFKKIGWKRKEESAPPPSSQPAVSGRSRTNCFWVLEYLFEDGGVPVVQHNHVYHAMNS